MYIFELAEYLEKLEQTSARNEITQILARVLRRAGAGEVDKICYLLLGELLPPYRGLEINLAEKMMLRVAAATYGKTEKEIEKLYKSKGDLGDAVYALASVKKLKYKNLEVDEVYDRLIEVALESGEGSQERKIVKMSNLLSELDPLSAKFVARIPPGKLRLGFSELTLLDAFSLMETGDKSARPLIENAFNVTADIGEIAVRIKKYGLAGLKNIEPKPGIPIRPSLAERLSKFEEIFEKAGSPVAVEQKLDGFRIQIHVWSEADEKKVALFSRNLENTTLMFPEIVASAGKLKVKSAILDGEAIGYNPRTKKFAPFQETVQRKRKHDIEEFAQKIPLNVFVFDILYLDGRSLLGLVFQERRKILEKVLIGSSVGAGALRLASQRVTDSFEVVKKELKSSLEAGLEGLVIKNLSTPYEAGSRGFHWIKLKATSGTLEKLRLGGKKVKSAVGASSLPDTIDCVLMGAWRGRGKRAKFGVGGFLLGVRGGDERYYTISRLGTGLSDEQFKKMSDYIRELKTVNKPKDYVVDQEIEPDIWVKPKLVVEILADEITLSPRHTAGRKQGRGYSLRFPRLVRFRDDKDPEDVTTVKEIAKMYKEGRSSH